MVGFLQVVLIVIFFLAEGGADLVPEAITVYRNPEFFKNLNYNVNQKSPKVAEDTRTNYKYPGETKKPNPPAASPGFEINYDNSPEFHHEPRDIFVDTTYKPTKKKGPYGPRYTAKKQTPLQEKGYEEEGSKETKGSLESPKSSSEEPQDFVSAFNESPEEEFQSYHEPILLARPTFDPVPISGYNKPYPYNRSKPILYDEWKFYNYPKIHANQHLKSDSRIYSEEPPNSFEDDSSYFKYEDEIEDASNFFEADEFKNLGADTKHIYKKLLKPKKSFLFKLHSKPKFKKLKFKLKKKHLHNTDWFDEYPFNF